MTPSLKLSEKIKNRLLSQKGPNFGKVYGILSKNNLFVLALHVERENQPIINSLPAEIYLCGILKIGDGLYEEQAIKDSLNEVYVTDNPVFINYKIGSDDINASFYKNGQLEKTSVTVITEQEVLSQFLHIRLRTHIPLTCEVTLNAIKEAFLNLRKNVASGIMSFNFNKSNIYLLANENENKLVGVTGNPTIGELIDEINEPSEGIGRKKKVQTFSIDVVDVNMLKKMTIEYGATPSKEHAPLCVLDRKQCKVVSFAVPIDALAIVHRQTKITSLYEIFVESAVRNLRLLESTFLACQNHLNQPEIFHFYPQDCGHFITKVYLKDESDEGLLEERRQLHEGFLLNQLRPQFKRANNFAFKSGNSGGPLTNPHEGLKITENGGKVALVKGKYLYYHYCQNRMDDDGWGCAYRSLQTLASWFQLQGYTDKDVPNFNDIQQCLVDIGDKPKSFVGSKQWIGSTEVNYVLNTLLGVTSKILYVSSGEEMATKGPELVSHFENHGAPVMIGGGVLAHTILGVDYNSQTGNLKFLILDPHYTGGEDLHTIQSKGWCGWKNVDFWDKTAYYNMCLPQVPIGI